MSVARMPLSWYAAKVEAGEPIRSLLWGDGEFLVAGRHRTNCAMAFGELADRRMEDELRAALACDDTGFVHGTEPFLVEPETYAGRDREGMLRITERLRELIADVRPGNPPAWYDGVVWDKASREGKLWLFIRACRKRRVVLVGHPRLRAADLFPGCAFVEIPPTNAWAATDRIKRDVVDAMRTDADVGIDGKGVVVLFCAGLGTIPLIWRLRTELPAAAMFDIGSAFDVFVGLGEERGWRKELYAKPEVWDAVKRANFPPTHRVEFWRGRIVQAERDLRKSPIRVGVRERGSKGADLAMAAKDQKIVDDHVPKGGAVLDVGCGWGEIALLVPPECPYVGFDLVPEFVDEARRILDGRLPAPEVFVGDVTDPAVWARFRDGQFAVALGKEVEATVGNAVPDEWTSVLRQMVRVAGKVLLWSDQHVSPKVIMAGPSGEPVTVADARPNNFTG